MFLIRRTTTVTSIDTFLQILNKLRSTRRLCFLSRIFTDNIATGESKLISLAVQAAWGHRYHRAQTNKIAEGL